MRPTNDDEVDILREQLTPLHAPHIYIAGVLLSRRLIEEFIEEGP